MNPFKTALRHGPLQIGFWQALGSAYTAEICAGAGFDWLLLDAEHGPNDVLTTLSQLQAVAAYPVEAVVRPPVGDASLIKQYLDIGARSLLVPMVESGAQAQALVRAVRYPPRGVRGVGSALGRASRWNRTPAYLAEAERDICLLLQVESRAGLENLDDIAQVEGVDGVFIGPSDLAAALGRIGAPEHPEVQAAIEDALGRLGRAGTPAGILAADQALARRYMSLGIAFIAVGVDVTVLARGAEAIANTFKPQRKTDAAGRPSVTPD